jgi:hypothetical protein
MHHFRAHVLLLATLNQGRQAGQIRRIYLCTYIRTVLLSYRNTNPREKTREGTRHTYPHLRRRRKMFSFASQALPQQGNTINRMLQARYASYEHHTWHARSTHERNYMCAKALRVKQCVGLLHPHIAIIVALYLLTTTSGQTKHTRQRPLNQKSGTKQLRRQQKNNSCGYSVWTTSIP